MVVVAATYPEPPKNIMEFSRRFATEEACAEYLFRLRYPNGYACTKCGSVRAWHVAEKLGMMICENNHKVSVTAGTSLARTKQPLTVWFHAAWLVATLKPGISAMQFQRQLGLTRLETAWTMLHKLRSGLFAPDRNKLTSDCTDQLHTDHWIEVDEVLVGGKEEGVEHRGGGAETKTLVAVAVEVHSWYGVPDDCDTKDTKRRARAAGHTRAGRCRMHVIADTKAETLTEFIRRNVAPGSSIWTDASRSYNQSAREGYARRTTIAKDDPDPLPTLGRVTTNLKRWLVGTHKGAVQPQHLQAYLNEFVFRFNRRDIPWVAFNRALGLAALNRPAVQYEGLYKHTWVHPTPELS
jgi:transposase-like protein